MRYGGLSVTATCISASGLFIIIILESLKHSNIVYTLGALLIWQTYSWTVIRESALQSGECQKSQLISFINGYY